ncbi:MAG: two-component system response regulator [Gammaproteobacteria bacterium]|nr:two-component system response regulator [Gammaproteobacteria bacterium]
MLQNTEKPLVLVVDDTPDNIDVLGGVLRNEYEVKVALNGETALKIVQDKPRPDLILLDITMPKMNGYEVCQQLKADPATSNIPVIFVTARDDVADEKNGFELGAVDYITKPISPAIVQARVKTHLSLHDQNRTLTRLVSERTEELNDTRLKVIQRLGRAAEYKDNETGMHVVRMSYFSKLIAQAYGGNAEWVDRLFNAAPMHDVGKIGIPDHILLKPGKLDAEEWELMKKHTLFGAEIIGDDKNPLLQMSRTIALTHHERWDGSGYPHGMEGKDIPLSGRIVAIADVFDALTSERPYKKAWSVEDAVDAINQDSGSHFDPTLIKLFNQVLPDIIEIRKRYADEDEA